MRFFKKTLLTRLITALLLTAGGAGLIYLKQEGEQIASRAAVKWIKNRSKKHNIDFKWENLKVSFLLLQIKITKPVFKWPGSKTLPQPIAADELLIRPDYTRLLKKQLTPALFIKKPRITLKTSRLKERLTKLFKPKSRAKTPSKTPALKIVLKHAELQVITPYKGFKAQNIAAVIDVQPKAVFLKTSAETVQVGRRPPFFFSMALTLQKQKAIIKKLSFYNAYSSLEMSGVGRGLLNKAPWFKSARLKISTVLEDQDWAALNQLIYPGNKFFFYKGRIAFTGQGRYKHGKINGDFTLSASGLETKNILFSDLHAKGSIQNTVLYFKKLNISRFPAWNVQLGGGQLHLKPPYRLQTDIRIKNSQLYSLLQAVNVKKAPISSFITGRFNCQGHLKNFVLNCNGGAGFKRFIVYGKRKTWAVLNLPAFQTNTRVRVQKAGFQADGDIKTKSSHIHFTSHFRNKVFAANLNGELNLTKDVHDLLYLKPKGKLKIQKGRMFISLKKNLIRSHLTIEDMMLGGVRGGDLSSSFYYLNGGLHFQKIKGRFKKSPYQGGVHIDIPTNKIKAFVNSKQVFLENIKTSLAGKFLIPFSLAGRGQAKGEIHGVMKKHSLFYKLQGKFKEVQWAEELFDQALIHLTGQKGKVQLHQGELHKKSGVIQAQGVISPQKKIQAQVLGRGLKLEDFQNITKRFGSDLLGEASFSLQAGGRGQKPEAKAKLTIVNTYFKGRPKENSQLFLKFWPHQIDITGSVFNTLHIQKLTSPYGAKKPIVIKAKAENLNIYEFLLKRGRRLKPVFQSFIDGGFNLSYLKNRFKKTSSGSVNIKRMEFYSPAGVLKNKQPVFIRLKNGRIFTNSFQLAGLKQNINIAQPNEDIHIKGGMHLDYLMFLFPFLKTLEGHLQADLTLSPRLHRLNPRGEVGLKEGGVHLHPVLEPFENIRARAKVKNNVWHVKSLHAQTGGGSLNLHGQVAKTSGGLGVDLKGFFKGVRFRGLKTIRTTGTGQIALKGQRFPYTLTADADIENTKIETEFQPQKQLVPVSSFLEKALRKKQFDPLKLALHLNLKTPADIENSKMKSLLFGKLQVMGSPRRPLLTGKLFLKPGGAIIFRDHKFKIISAGIKYMQSPPHRPWAAITAQTSVRDASSAGLAEQYSIQLKVKARGGGGEPVFTLTSVPALSENEIISLLAFGAKGGVFKEAGRSSQTAEQIAKYSSYQMGSAVLQKVLDKELNHILGLDQFLIVPYINHKKHTVSTKLIVKKKIFNKLNLAAARTILDQNPENNLTAEYEINKHTSLIGFWKNEDPLELSDKPSNTIGFDLEYQIDF